MFTEKQFEALKNYIDIRSQVGNANHCFNDDLLIKCHEASKLLKYSIVTKQSKRIKHDGGECPVHPETIVKIYLADGRAFDNCTASNLHWPNDAVELENIIEYEIVEEYRDPEKANIICVDDNTLLTHEFGHKMLPYNPKTHFLVPIQLSKQKEHEVIINRGAYGKSEDGIVVQLHKAFKQVFHKVDK